MSIYLSIPVICLFTPYTTTKQIYLEASIESTIEKDITHYDISGAPCRYCIIRAELLRTSRHTEVRVRLYIVVPSDGRGLVSNAAKASTLVSGPIRRRAKAKVSVTSELIA